MTDVQGSTYWQRKAVAESAGDSQRSAATLVRGGQGPGLGTGRRQSALRYHRLVTHDHHEGDCRTHWPTPPPGRSRGVPRATPRWRAEEGRGHRSRSPAGVTSYFGRDYGGDSNEPLEVDNEVHPGHGGGVGAPRPSGELAHGRAVSPRPGLLAAIEPQNDRGIAASESRRAVPVPQSAGDALHPARRSSHLMRYEKEGARREFPPCG